MITRYITPIAELDRRAPEAGRIRIGVKTERAMKAINTLRFTSVDSDIINAIAARYGGTPRPWHDASANPANQFEVISTSSEIRVMLMPDGLTQWYEHWLAGGCKRRCDGNVCQVPEQRGDDYEIMDVDCLCRAEDRMICKPKTRLTMVLPEFKFMGTWRFETSGWTAAAELPGMDELIRAFATRGRMVDAVFAVEERNEMINGKKKNFVVPRLSILDTVEELAAGQVRVAIGPAAQGPAPLELSTPLSNDDEPIEAEVITPELLEVEALLRADARNYGMDEDAYVDAIKASTSNDLARMRECSRKVRAEEIWPTGWNQGRVQWGSLDTSTTT